MSIHALDNETVKLIRTTQIITSIYTAAKELIENALDAKAGNIEINLLNSGLSLIEVKDDGCGIPKTDIAYAALPSYTSKIQNFEDLETLNSYGFRGEALNALCTVSDVIITTKSVTDDTAVSYFFNESGNIIQSELSHQAVGTTVNVKDIFKRFPVRKQLITNSKKADQAVKLLESLIKGLSICKPSVRMSYKVDNTVMFFKPKMHDIKEAAAYVFGKKISSCMHWIQHNEETEFMALLRMMVPRKEVQDVSELIRNSHEFIFINDRLIRNKEIEKIIRKRISEHFGETLSSKKKRTFLLHMSLQPNNIDVNLEPNKDVILFKNQDKVVNVIDKCLRQYYGIQCTEVVEQDLCSNLDCSLEMSQCTASDTNTEVLAHKKRKLTHEDTIEESINGNKTTLKTHSSNILETVNHNVYDTLKLPNQDNFNMPGHTPYQNGVNQNNKTNNELQIFVKQLASPNLSDSDSDYMLEEQMLIPSNNVFDNAQHVDSSIQDTSPVGSYECKDINRIDTDISEDYTKSLSQISHVSLGEDFCLESILEPTIDKNTICPDDIQKESVKQCMKDNLEKITLDVWSKGHVPGIIGGTDVKHWIDAQNTVNQGNTTETKNDLNCEGSTCEGFKEYSRIIRPQIVEHNPTFSVAQVASEMIKCWRELSPMDRRYYRELALKEKVVIDVCTSGEREKKQKQTDTAKNQNRLLKMFDKIKATQMEKKENLIMRTIVPWDIDQKAVNKGFMTRTLHPLSCLVVGSLTGNTWLVHKNAQIWIVDVSPIITKLNTPNLNVAQICKEDVEKLLKQWFQQSSDLSMMHPIYSLNGSRNKQTIESTF